MTRHLADHRAPTDGGRIKHFVRIARSEGSAFWQRLSRLAPTRAAGNRRLVEYARIAKTRQD
jgi:hypothetical protein